MQIAGETEHHSLYFLTWGYTDGVVERGREGAVESQSIDHYGSSENVLSGLCLFK